MPIIGNVHIVLGGCLRAWVPIIGNVQAVQCAYTASLVASSIVCAARWLCIHAVYKLVFLQTLLSSLFRLCVSLIALFLRPLATNACLKYRRPFVGPPCSVHAAYRKLAGKELVEDATFDLERRRNRPEKYDREVREGRERQAAVL